MTKNEQTADKIKLVLIFREYREEHVLGTIALELETPMHPAELAGMVITTGTPKFPSTADGFSLSPGERAGVRVSVNVNPFMGKIVAKGSWPEKYFSLESGILHHEVSARTLDKEIHLPHHIHRNHGAIQFKKCFQKEPVEVKRSKGHPLKDGI